MFHCNVWIYHCNLNLDLYCTISKGLVHTRTVNVYTLEIVATDVSQQCQKLSVGDYPSLLFTFVMSLVEYLRIHYQKFDAWSQF